MKTKSKKIIIIMLAVVIAALSAAGGYFACKYAEQKKIYNEALQSVEKYTNPDETAQSTESGNSSSSNNTTQSIEDKIKQKLNNQRQNLKNQYYDAVKSKLEKAQTEADNAKSQMNKYKSFMIIFFIPDGVIIICLVAVIIPKKSKISKKSDEGTDTFDKND